MNQIYEELKEQLSQKKELKNGIYEHCKAFTEAVLDGKITDWEKIAAVMDVVLEFSDEDRFRILDSSLCKYVFHDHREMVRPVPECASPAVASTLKGSNAEAYDCLN